MERINWDSLPISAKDEIKSAVLSLINLLIGSDEFTQKEGFGRLLKDDLMCYQFALMNASFADIIRIGKIVEEAYYDWTESFNRKLAIEPTDFWGHAR